MIITFIQKNLRDNQIELLVRVGFEHMPYGLSFDQALKRRSKLNFTHHDSDEILIYTLVPSNFVSLQFSEGGENWMDRILNLEN